MLTKTKNIRKKTFFFQKFKKRPGVWPRASNNQNLKEIRALGSEIIVSRTDGRQTTDKLRFHELCRHSQAELKIDSVNSPGEATNEI